MSAVTVLGSAIRIVVKTLYVPSFDDSPACSYIERVLCRIERKCIVLGMPQVKQEKKGILIQKSKRIFL